MDFSISALLGMAPPPEGQDPGLRGLVPFVLIAAVMYFLVFAPMRRKQKKHTEMLAGLKAGDRVVTTGGIHGTVVGVSEGIVQLRIADQVKIELSRSAVADRLGDA